MMSGFKDLLLGQFFGPGKAEENIKKLQALGELAKELGYSQTQLALAWALANKDVSTLILGFSKTSYVDENLKALELYNKWNAEIEGKVEAILKNAPYHGYSLKHFKTNKTRRHIAVFEKKLL